MLTTPTRTDGGSELVACSAAARSCVATKIMKLSSTAVSCSRSCVTRVRHGAHSGIRKPTTTARPRSVVPDSSLPRRSTVAKGATAVPSAGSAVETWSGCSIARSRRTIARHSSRLATVRTNSTTIPATSTLIIFDLLSRRTTVSVAASPGEIGQIVPAGYQDGGQPGQAHGDDGGWQRHRSGRVAGSGLRERTGEGKPREHGVADHMHGIEDRPAATEAGAPHAVAAAHGHRHSHSHSHREDGKHRSGPDEADRYCGRQRQGNDDDRLGQHQPRANAAGDPRRRPAQGAHGIDKLSYRLTAMKLAHDGGDEDDDQ